MVEFWLCRLNVDGSIIKRFQEERIRGRHLHRLTENHLERLGCGNMGDRFDILNAISSIPPVENVCVGVGQRKQVGPPFRPPWSRVKPRVNNLGAPSTLDLNIAADLLDYVLEHFTSFEFDHTTIFNILDFLYGHYDPPGKSSIGRSKLLEAIRIGTQLQPHSARATPQDNQELSLMDQLRMRLNRNRFRAPRRGALQSGASGPPPPPIYPPPRPPPPPPHPPHRSSRTFSRTTCLFDDDEPDSSDGWSD